MAQAQALLLPGAAAVSRVVPSAAAVAADKADSFDAPTLRVCTPGLLVSGLGSASESSAAGAEPARSAASYSMSGAPQLSDVIIISCHC